jgi:hypothetical protein
MEVLRTPFETPAKILKALKIKAVTPQHPFSGKYIAYIYL